MKRNLRQEYLEALDKELRACGFPASEEAQSVLSALKSGRVPKGTSDSNAFMRGFYSTFAAIFRAAAKRIPIRNEAELDRALHHVYGLRHKLRPELARSLENLHKLAPKKKPGPKTLTEAEKQNVCSIVETFKANGMTVAHAIETVAKQVQKTPRQIRRIWQGHGSA